LVAVRIARDFEIGATTTSTAAFPLRHCDRAMCEARQLVLYRHNVHHRRPVCARRCVGVAAHAIGKRCMSRRLARLRGPSIATTWSSTLFARSPLDRRIGVYFAAPVRSEECTRWRGLFALQARGCSVPSLRSWTCHGPEVRTGRVMTEPLAYSHAAILDACLPCSALLLIRPCGSSVRPGTASAPGN